MKLLGSCFGCMYACTSLRSVRKRARQSAAQVSVPDAQLEQLDALEGSWAGFRSCLDETAASLEKAKDSFRDKLVHMVDSFATDVVVSRDMFTQDAPYSNEVSSCNKSHCCFCSAHTMQLSVPAIQVTYGHDEIRTHLGKLCSQLLPAHRE